MAPILFTLAASGIGFILGKGTVTATSRLTKSIFQGEEFQWFRTAPPSLNQVADIPCSLDLAIPWILALALGYVFWLQGFAWPFWMATMCFPLLFGCFLTDYKYCILPDELTLGLLWIGLAGSLLPIFVSSQEAILGAVCGYGFFWLSNFLFRCIRGVEGMYPGDFKLNAAIGALFGLQGLTVVVFLSMTLLVLISLSIRLLKNTAGIKQILEEEIPYGCYSVLVSFGWFFYQISQQA